MQDKPNKTGFHEFKGNAWILPSIEAARAVYQMALENLLPRSSSEDWSIVTCLFEGRATLTFLWKPNLAPETVTTIERLVMLAKGKELEEEAKETLLIQILARREGLEAKEPFKTLVAYHPRGKVWWDLGE